ncbi:KICSTOR complex protein ITFG2-like [Mytilus galloprovincialis]|uniref:ITFG2 n=1 Tax=Mytilus edulis TaxID=6550 RepID=A0A8S3VLW5_MYTED|nr:ITFG2 [Mytilus edulis]
MWRTVSFVERIEVDFVGNLFNQAILLGDVDNDQANELIVGNTEGDLHIFRGTFSSPWRKCSDLGMLTCIGIGDVCNKGKNTLLALTAEGWCYLFEVVAEVKKDDSKTETDAEEENRIILKPHYTQHLPANGKSLLIADVDGDGQIEIVVAYSDRVVRCFRWRQDSSSDMLEAGTGNSTGNLIQISQWQLSGQIGSLTVNLSEEGKPELLVAQPGGTYVKLCLTVVTGGESPGQSESTFVEERLGSARIRNSMITTEIVGGINKGNRGKAGGGTFYALSTLDGTLILIENKEILWSLQVDHQLFALTKLDVTGNGTEEVVCCGWDGQTYIVNHTRDVVRYQFEENVTAFTAGLYSVNQKDNVPSFVYATFNNKIFIYYNITLPRVESTNLIEVMDKMEETHELLTKLNITDPDTSQLRELYHWLLYGWKPDLSLEDDKT